MDRQGRGQNRASPARQVRRHVRLGGCVPRLQGPPRPSRHRHPPLLLGQPAKSKACNGCQPSKPTIVYNAGSKDERRGCRPLDGRPLWQGVFLTLGRRGQGRRLAGPPDHIRKQGQGRQLSHARHGHGARTRRRVHFADSLPSCEDMILCWGRTGGGGAGAAPQSAETQPIAPACPRNAPPPWNSAQLALVGASKCGMRRHARPPPRRCGRPHRAFGTLPRRASGLANDWRLRLGAPTFDSLKAVRPCGHGWTAQGSSGRLSKACAPYGALRPSPIPPAPAAAGAAHGPLPPFSAGACAVLLRKTAVPA